MAKKLVKYSVKLSCLKIYDKLNSKKVGEIVVF